MNKSELIDWISSVNRSATREFLADFTHRELTDYMRQLQTLNLVPIDRADPAHQTIDPCRAVTV